MLLSGAIGICEGASMTSANPVLLVERVLRLVGLGPKPR
jgi:hypothetical protein